MWREGRGVQRNPFFIRAQQEQIHTRIAHKHRALQSRVKRRALSTTASANMQRGRANSHKTFICNTLCSLCGYSKGLTDI